MQEDDPVVQVGVVAVMLGVVDLAMHLTLSSVLAWLLMLLMLLLLDLRK